MGAVYKVEDKNLKYAIDKIYYWYKKNIKYLTIITVPFNTSCIFIDIIKSLSQKNEKILYVSGRNSENKELITALKNNHMNIKYSCKEGLNSTLIFVNYKDLLSIKLKYELVIFDDITWFSELTSKEVREVLERCAQIGNRVILYSVEKAAVVGEKVELAAYNYKQPFIEPRILTTRIDLNKDIPYILYDYLVWFKDNKCITAICVPNKSTAEKVFDYFNNKLQLSQTKIIKAFTYDEIKKYSSVLKYNNRSIFIITNKMKELFQCCKIDDIIVLFADNSRYTYKKLIYLCGYLHQFYTQMTEILLVANTECDDMEKARKMARNFNKKVWEKKLKRL